MNLKNLIYVSGALLIGIAVCASVFFVLREHKVMFSPKYSKKTSPNNKGITENSKSEQSSQNPGTTHGETKLTKEQRIARRTKNLMPTIFEKVLTISEQERMLEIMDSPEYFEMLEKPSTRNFFDFWESKGFQVPWGAERELFSRKYPGKPEDHESEMRVEVAKLFLAAVPVDLTDPEAAARQRMEVYKELSKDDWMETWYSAQFEEDWDGIFLWRREDMKNNPALVWMTDVQQNAENIVANAKTTGVNTPETQESAPSWDLSSVVESPSADSSKLDTFQRPTMTDTEIEAAIEKSLTPQTSDPLTNQRTDTPDEIQNNLETTLRAQFSSGRFERAMSTLDRYGPEEGLRRLRENDPEVAKQIEQHQNRSRSGDSDKSEEEASQ